MTALAKLPRDGSDGSRTVSPPIPQEDAIKRLCADYLAGRANGTIPRPAPGTFYAAYAHFRQAGRERG